MKQNKFLVLFAVVFTIALLPFGFAPTASAAIDDACGNYASTAKTACEKGYNGTVACSSYIVPAEQTACNAGKTQAATDAKQNGTGTNNQNNNNNNGNNTQNGTNNQQQNTSGPGECGGTKTGVLSCSESSGIAAIGGLIKLAVNVLTILIGIVAVGGIAYAAILYASARDNQSQVQNAIAIIRNIIIGLVLYGFTIAIINWLIPGGVIG